MDYIDPEKNRKKELLKHMILQLHKGEAPDEVRGRLAELLQTIPYNEVVEAADIILLLVDHKEFRQLRAADLKEKILIDTRGVIR